MKCAAFELPFTNDEHFGAEGRRDEVDLQAILSVLSEEGFVHQADGQWNWTNESYPADAVSLRSVSSDNFIVVDCTNGERVIGETDFTSGPSTLHEKAIYILEGQLFQVERLDFDGRKAYCARLTATTTPTRSRIRRSRSSIRSSRGSSHRLPASSDASEGNARAEAGLRGESRTQPRVPDSDSGVPGSIRSHGEVHVVSRVVGFKKIKFYTNENIGSGELDLPEQQMHTSSYWLTIPAAVMATLPFAGDDRRDGVVGLAFAMKNIAQLLLMCDGHDIGLSVDGGTLERSKRTGGIGGVPDALATDPNVFIYDNYPGGIGFSRPLFEMHALLLARTRELIAGCPCESGCPSCVGPEGNTGTAREAGGVADPRRCCSSGGRLMDLSSRLRAIVKGGPPKPTVPRRARRPARADLRAGHRRVRRPDGSRRASPTSSAGGLSETPFGQCLVIDRRYEADRFHGTHPHRRLRARRTATARAAATRRWRRSPAGGAARSRRSPRTLVHRSRDHRAERRRRDAGVPGRLRLLRSRRVPGAAVPAHEPCRRARAARRGRGVLRRRGSDRHLQRQDVRRAGDGDALDVPPAADAARATCRTSTCCIRRGGCGGRAPVRAATRGGGLPARRRSSTRCSTSRGSATCPGFEIPGRFFQFLRSGDPRPLEPVLEHNRLDLVSLAAVMARARAAARGRARACRDGAEALALGRVFERARRLDRARSVLRRAAVASRTARGAEARRCTALGLRLPAGRALRRGGGLRGGDRRADRAARQRRRRAGRCGSSRPRRSRSITSTANATRGARELALFALQEPPTARADGMRHRLARLDRKIGGKRTVASSSR